MALDCEEAGIASEAIAIGEWLKENASSDMAFMGAFISRRLTISSVRQTMDSISGPGQSTLQSHGVIIEC